MQKTKAYGIRTRRKRRKILLSFLCTFTVLCSTLVAFVPAVRAEAADSDAPELENLIIDRVYELTPLGEIPDGVTVNDTGFAPEITEYEGTAYSSVNEIKVYPFAESDTAEVRVNGSDLNDEGYFTVDVSEPGSHEVKVEVSDNGDTTDYTVDVEKVDTDYRDRRPVVKNETIMDAFSVSTSFDNEEQLLEVMEKDYNVVLPESSKADGSYVETEESYWSVPGGSLPDASGTDTPVELFTVDLGDTYSVSRIRAAFGPSNMNLSQNRVRISVSTDGETWETPVTKGNMNTGTQYHQNVTRYEFGVSYDARYIRFEVTNWQFGDQKDLRIYQFMIFYDAGEVPEKQDAPEGAGVPHQHEDRHQYLAGGQATVVERGLTMSGWTPSSGYGRGIPTAEEAEQFGYDGPLFYDPDFENPDYMLYNPDALWGIAKAPFGGNNMASAGEPADFIPESMKPYIGNAISFCFGDEGGYSTSEAEAFGKWFDWTREHYPGVILHTNQFPNQWSRANLLEYFRIAEPDMICWDDYYGDSSWANPSSINLSNENVQRDAARRLLNLNTWKLYRELAHGGIDGTGSKPILFGQYLDAFAFNHSQSNKNLIVNTSILSGAKWLNFFRLEYQFDRAYLWDEDGTPTRGLLEWGQIIDRVHAIDDQLTRLNNDWIMFKMGSIGNEANASADGFRMGDFDDESSSGKNLEYGLADVSVTSLSEAHDGGTGDVVLGYYNTLPGLYESEIAEYFEGATAPKAFMIMNGLVAGQAERYNQFNIPAREAGSSDNTRQEITVTVDADFAAEHTLYMVDKDDTDENGSGKIKEVELSGNSFTVTLGGGEANLYFWDTDTTASADSAGEGTYASFAFDSHSETYWQPAEENGSYVLTNTFEPCTVDQVTILEKGNAVKEFHLEYLDENGDWKSFGEAGTEIGAVTTVAADAPVNAQGIRLVITAADGIPAVYEIQVQEAAAEDPDQVNTLQVNDNTLGDGLFRFSYDELWSYRETETNDGMMSGSYPIENDGHFSNWAGAEASFKFYGTGVELKLRADQASHIRAAVFDSEGHQIRDWTAGTNSGAILFSDLAEDNAVYTLKIQKADASQAGIDGAVVTYKGAIPSSIEESSSTGASAVQEYVDQRTTEGDTNYFTYEPEAESKQMGTDNSGFNQDTDEATGWVEHVQDAQYQNLGFTRTNMDGASYTLNFYGTGVQLYSGVTPMGDTTEGMDYGTLTFELDGEPVSAQALDVTDLGTNGKVSARMWTVNVPDAGENGDHTLKVTVNGGYSRIDYAVVNRYWEEAKDVQGDYTVAVASGENGIAQVQGPERVPAGGNAVILITPDDGYEVDSIIVNNVSVTVPDDGQLVLTDIREDMNVQVTFRTASYDIVLESSEGGAVIPSSLKAEEGETVTLTPDVYEEYEFVSVSVKAQDGSTVETVVDEETGVYTFTMPASDVTVSGTFRKIEAADKTELKNKIEQAEQILKDLDQYVDDADAKQAFEDALTNAKAVYDNADAVQAEVDEAESTLANAMNALHKKADKSGLEQLVGELQKIDLTKYTEESGQVLSDALAEAEDLLNQDLAESDQQQITDMISKLEAARNQLVPVKEDPENPGSGGEDSDKPENPDKPADPGESGGQDKNDGSAVPSTGDSAPVMAAAFVLLLSGSVLVFVTKQRKMK